MTAAAILGDARARLAALWPLAADRTDDPHPAPEGALPAFAVTLEPDAPAEPRAMGSTEYRAAATLEVRLMVSTRPAADLAAALHAAADAADAAILGAPYRLGGLAWSIYPAARSTDHAASETRLSALTLSYAVTYHTPPPAAALAPGLGLV